MRNLSRMTAPHWLGVYGLILVGWVGIWQMAAPTGITWVSLIADICRAIPQDLGAGPVFFMWALMALAMMLPTALPAFATFDQISDSQGTGGGGYLVAGYTLIWLGFAVLAAIAQLALLGDGRSQASWLAPILLILAGLYQFSPLKAACLSKCRQPLTFFMGHWHDGPFRMGLRLGATCLGCCWALMALGLIGGAMSLGFMALATLLMTLEKLSDGTLLPRAFGLACLSGAGFLIGGFL